MDSTAPKELDTRTTSNVAQSKMHAEVFSNPDEYLSFLQNNFSKLSRGHKGLLLNDLKVDVGDNTLDPQLRTAAAITAAHYNDLLTLTDAESSRGFNGSLKSYDISYAQAVADDPVAPVAAGMALIETMVVGALAVAGGNALLLSPDASGYSRLSAEKQQANQEIQSWLK
jgi:hypothetical protein